MTITLTDTYRHLDGTPGAGYVLVRTVTPFHDGQGTVLGDWVSYPLASDGSVSIVIDADLEHADPGPQWLQIMEQITCQRGGVWEIGPDVLFASADPTIELGTVRQLPAITADAPRYVPVPGVPGAPGAPGPAGPQGPPGPVDYADFMGMTPVDYDPTASYVEDDIVRFNGALWVVKRAVGPGEDPATKPGSYQNMMLDDVAIKARNAQNGLSDKVDKAGDVMSGQLIVPPPNHAAQVPRLARNPDPTTGDLGLPGWAGSDTGWRNITALLENGWAASGVRLRRVGATVFLSLYTMNVASVTNTQALTMPTGFHAGNQLSNGHVGVGLGGSTGADDTVQSSVTLAGGQGNIVRLATAATAAFSAVVSIPVSSDWPTTLPGTEVTPPATWS